MKKTFFISTAIDYPSEKGHIGHALEKVQADVLARYKKLQGFDVWFSTGTDEHGRKIEKSAEKVNKKPQEFVDEISKNFKEISKVLNISYNDFIRTTEKRHKKVVQEIFNKIYEKGDIYKGKYKGLYCVECETYYLTKDLENNKCPVHKKSLEQIEEETYFFKLSKYQKALIEHIKNNKDFIIPQSRRNEILNRLKEPLQDLSISRKNVKWGIPLPINKDFTLFVWVDALINYLSTIDYPNNKFKKFWPADVHVIGKDIIWHHTVIWGSILLSAGLELSKTIFVHGFVTANGQKISKSLGNVIDPIELVKKYGTDPVRYYLLREIPTFGDGDFSIKRFEERYNSDLANGIGNLVARVLTLATKFRAPSTKNQISNNIQIQINQTKKNYEKLMGEFKLYEALEEIWKLISFCDEYIEKEKPWGLTDKKKLEEILSNLLYCISEIADLIAPFLPETSEKIKEQIRKRKSEILFPRILC
jgi:methionyl-tRNA synthetase